MNLIPWRGKRDTSGSPAENPLGRLREEVDTLFDRFWRDPFSMDVRRAFGDIGMGAFPRTDLVETDKDVAVAMDLPGIDPQDVDIRIEGDTLTISGEKKQEREEKKQTYHFVERHYGTFRRSLQLPGTVDPDKVDASYKDGVLTVRIAKNPQVQPKRIVVKS